MILIIEVLIPQNQKMFHVEHFYIIRPVSRETYQYIKIESNVSCETLYIYNLIFLFLLF